MESKQLGQCTTYPLIVYIHVEQSLEEYGTNLQPMFAVDRVLHWKYSQALMTLCDRVWGGVIITYCNVQKEFRESLTVATNYYYSCCNGVLCNQ